MGQLMEDDGLPPLPEWDAIDGNSLSNEGGESKPSLWPIYSKASPTIPTATAPAPLIAFVTAATAPAVLVGAVVVVGLRSAGPACVIFVVAALLVLALPGWDVVSLAYGVVGTAL